MAAKPSVSKSPPPPPPPTQVSPGDRLQNPTFSISVDSASGRERIIRKPLKFKTETPPPPPPTVSLSKSARQHSPTRYAGTRIGGGFHVDNVDTYKAEISRLSLLESSLRSEMHNINLEKNGWMEKAQDLERALTVKEAELYSMTAKVKELESTNAVRGSLRKILSNEDGESVIPMDQLQRIEKEMAEQEKLLAGYQHENEKLMEKLRLADKKTDQVREDMYKASMRTGFEDTKQQTPKLAGDELRRLLKAEEAVESLDKELEEQKQSNAKLKAELVELRDEKPTSSTEEALNSLRNELAEARYEHLSEAKALKEKLAWYAENQALINANEELIDKQAARISELESNLGTSPAKTGRPKVSLPQDLKRIRTLEKQVKELDEALRKRNPNCLANLILAAGPSDSEKQTRRELRQKVAELEDELEKREGRFSSRIRTLRQEHERVKVRYERLLETSKAQEENIDASNHHFSPVTDSKIASLEQELVRVRDFYRKKLEDQSKKSSMALRSAKRDGTAGLTPSLQSMQRDADKLRAAKIALEARVEELEMQLDSRGKKPVAQSNKKVEHLENKLERISNENAQLKRDMDGLLSKKQMPTRRMEGKVKDDNEDGEDSVLVEIIEQVEASESKDSKLENEEYSLQKALKKSQEERAHISKKLQQVIDENALMNTRWEQALRRSEQAVERLHVANLELEAQLQEAKKDLNTPQTPSMLQHQALARKLEDMEQKFRARERELELLVQQVKHAADIDLQTAQTKYDMVLADKDREILRFRRELDELISALQQ
uniref:Centrosomal protein of 162 kDa n=1 Tax=Mucochytrium quahogii TaxID=96639 RepID=A0A7S2SCF1_9STRA